MFIISYLLQLILSCQSKEHSMPHLCALATSTVRREPRLGLQGSRISPWAADRKIGHLSYLPPQSLLPSQ